MKKYILLILLTILTLYSQTNLKIKPDSYSKEGFCIVNTSNQRMIGLTRFKTNKQFLEQCKGKMIFKYKKDSCHWFTMKEMKFDIYIKDKKENKLFKVGDIKKVCGDTITESSTSLYQE